MCYAIPAKLIEIKGNIGIVDYFGEKRNVLLDLIDVQIGDYIYAQGGISIRKVSEEEALQILDTWKEVFFELKKTDEALSKVHHQTVTDNILAILQKVNLKKALKKEEMISLFKLEDQKELSVLYEVANNVRQQAHGNASCVHGIIEFSNYCDNNCFYCGIRKERKIKRYRMSVDEIIGVAKEAIDHYGFKAIVLQSGEDYWYDDEKLIKIINEIRKMGVLIFLSIGDRSKETYQKLYEAGARAALLRFETSNEAAFAKLRPGTNLKDRVELIKDLKEIGYVLATGFIIGLPGETEEDMVENILLTKSLGPDMYSFGPLIPTSDTPLSACSNISKNIVLKTTSITRFVDRDANILVTTALETLDQSAKKEALLAGANSMMINITPSRYKKLYSIYDNRICDTQSVDESVQGTIKLLYTLGRAPTDLGIIEHSD